MGYELDLTEFDKLEQMLKDAGIKYRRVEGGALGFHQLRSVQALGDQWLYDVVCNWASYGHESGLLEMWGKSMIEPEGWLSAEDCLKKIKEIVG